MKKTINLDGLRSQIDSIDQQLITLLTKRMELVKQVGEYKKAHHIPPLDEVRWRAVVATRTGWGEKLGLSKLFIQKIWDTIHLQALEIEHAQ